MPELSWCLAVDLYYKLAKYHDYVLTQTSGHTQSLRIGLVFCLSRIMFHHDSHLSGLVRQVTGLTVVTPVWNTGGDISVYSTAFLFSSSSGRVSSGNDDTPNITVLHTCSDICCCFETSISQELVDKSQRLAAL